jgi:Fibronectin type III domain
MKHLAFSSRAATGAVGLAVLLAGGTATGAMAAVPSASASASASASSPQQSTPTVPGAPTGLTVIPGNRQATLSWSSPVSDGGSPVQEYVVEGGTSPSSSAIWETTGSHTATIGHLTNGTTYYFSVHAENPDGDGASSAPVTVTPRARGYVPPGALAGAAGGLKTGYGDGYIVLWWSPPAPTGLPVTRYRVYLGTSRSLLGARTFTTSDTSFRLNDADNGVMYYIKVTALNASGEGPGTPEKSVIPDPHVVPAPTGLTARAHHGEVVLSWSRPKAGLNPGDGYLIYVGTRPGHEGAKPAVPYLIENVTSYTVAPLKNGTRYYFKVAFLNGADDQVSPRSAEVSAVPWVTGAGGSGSGGGSGSVSPANPLVSGGAQPRSTVNPDTQPSLVPLGPNLGQPTASSGLSTGLIVLLAALALAAAAGGATAAMLFRRRRYDQRYGPVPAPRRPHDDPPTGQSSREEEMNGPRYR